MEKINGKLLTLKEASKLTGIAVPALRMRIKKGKIEGLKSQTKNGEAWFVREESIRKEGQVEPIRLNAFTVKQFQGEAFHGEEDSPPEVKSLIQAKNEIIEGLKNHLRTYEALMGTFQERIQNLEYEKKNVENKIKMLPAPVEIVCEEMRCKERVITEAQKVIEEKSAVLKEKEDTIERTQRIIRETQEIAKRKDEELELLRQKLIEREKAYVKIEETRKRELEEHRKPWWKKIMKTLWMWK